MQNENPDLAKQYQSLLLVWGAILMSQLIFFLVIFIVKPELFRFDFSGGFFGENPPLIIALFAAALASVSLSFFMRSTLIKKAIDNRQPQGVNSAVIVGIAMCEAASLFGLLSAFIADYSLFFIFFAIGIVAMLLHFPKRDDIMAAGFKR